MEAIDFSCKHDILIRRPDGELAPMDEPRYDVTEIAPGTWQIMSVGDFHYLLAGEDEGIAIDTGYGAGNLREFLEGLCGKPVRCVINTHDHFDHTANNCYFDLAIMSEVSAPLATLPFPSFAGIDFPRDYPIRTVRGGDTVKLRGRDLQIFDLHDHTLGGIAILDRKQRLLFTGDEIQPGGKNFNGPVSDFLRGLEPIMAYRNEFDRICCGPGVESAEAIDVVFEACKRIISGEGSDSSGFHAPFHIPAPPQEHEGHVVYDCQPPRPQDINGGKPIVPRTGTEVIMYRGRRFEYDPKLK